ncbi:unnamed protein product [Heterobilharzia americana]|nr:unnamed protein product [Heterobilharzia americana]
MLYLLISFAIWLPYWVQTSCGHSMSPRLLSLSSREDTSARLIGFPKAFTNWRHFASPIPAGNKFVFIFYILFVL